VRSGYLSARLSGADGVISRFAQHEPGGHRFQRVPPTEKRGRTHTSTITISVLREPRAAEVYLDPRDLDVRKCRGGGAGGQHRNTTDSAVQVTHRPTGTIVRVESERSQHQNKATALAILRARLAAAEQERLSTRRNARRRSQLGSGMRADKRRTVALQRGQVTDHVTGRRIQAKAYLRGDLAGLWP